MDEYWLEGRKRESEHSVCQHLPVRAEEFEDTSIIIYFLHYFVVSKATTLHSVLMKSEHGISQTNCQVKREKWAAREREVRNER